MQTGREKKSIHNGCIYYLPHLTCNVPKMMELHFLHSLYRSYFLSVPYSALSTCFWLVVAYKIVYHQPTKASMYAMHFIFLSFDSMVQMIGLRPPTRSPPERLSSSTSLQRPPTIGLIVLLNLFINALNLLVRTQTEE
jgi:hypothetical protein